MELTCHLCDCTIPMSYDADKTEHNLSLHLTGNRHIANIEFNRENFYYIDCNLCQKSFQIYSYYFNLVRHLREQCHLNTLEEYSNFEPESSTDEYGSESNYYSDDEEEESYESSDYENSYDEENSYETDGTEGYYTNNEYRKPFFYCELCQCAVTIATKGKDAGLQQILTHISGNRHQNNLDDQDNENPNRMHCNLCQCYLQLSYDNNVSLQNIETHLVGQRHGNNSPLSDDDYDDPYSSPIYQPD